jgi:multidrug efflux pump
MERLYRASERFFDGMLNVYRTRCLWVLDNSGLMLVVLLLTIALNVVLIIKIPKGFFPQQDTGAMVGGVQGPQDASFGVMNASIKALVNVIKADPAWPMSMPTSAGGGGGSNGGFIYAALKPLDERKVSAAEIINRLRPKMNRCPWPQAFLQAAQDLRIGGRGSNALYQYTLQADNVSRSGQVGTHPAGAI